MKIAYAGFDMLFDALQALYDNGCEIEKIFTCKVDNVSEFNKKVASFALNHNVPITYEKITLDDLKELKQNGVDALFCGAYYYRIPILKNFKMINIHPSLLPIGRGAWPTAYAILNDINELGVTFHKMEESFDTGDIILQKPIEISRVDNHETLMNKILTAIPDMISTLLDDFDNYYKNAEKQVGGEYWDEPDEKDYVITENSDFVTADKILRAFYGFSATYHCEEGDVKISKGTAVKGENKDKHLKIQGGYIEKLK